MKKVVLGMTIVTMAGMLMACGSDGDTKENQNKNTTQSVAGTTNQGEVDTTESQTTPVDELSDEYLLSLPESPAKDFRYKEIEGGISIKDYRGEDDIIVVPTQIDGKNVIEIGQDAFKWTSAKAIVTGKNVTCLGYRSFCGCSIDRVLINGPVTKIEEEAFINGHLKEVVLPDTLKEIGPLAFTNASLTKIELPKSVETIRQSAFGMCSKLEEVIFVNGNVQVESNAFGTCEKLTRVYIPDTDIQFQEGVFYESPNVTIITPSGSAAEKYAKENDIKVENK